MTRKSLTPWSNPACTTYLIIGLVASAMIVLSIAERTVGLFGLAPAIIAATGLVFGWINAPVFVLLAVAIALLIAQPMFLPHSNLVDMILAASILAYVVAHYRLCSLTSAAFPTDTRRQLTKTTKPGRPPLPAVLEFFMALTIVPYLVYLALRKSGPRPPTDPERRTTTDLPPEEIVWTMVAVVGCSGVALAIWLLTYWGSAPLYTYPRHWQLGLILWIVVLPVLLMTALASYIRWRNASVMEARLVLGDDLWTQTRREQRRVARWTVWARKRQEREVRS